MTKPGPEDAIQLSEPHDLSSYRRPMAAIPPRVQSVGDRGDVAITRAA